MCKFSLSFAYKDFGRHRHRGYFLLLSGLLVHFIKRVFDEHAYKLLCLLLVNFFLLLSLIIFWVRYFIHPKIKKIFTCGLFSFPVSCLFLLYIWSNFCIGRAWCSCRFHMDVQWYHDHLQSRRFFPSWGWKVYKFVPIIQDCLAIVFPLILHTIFRINFSTSTKKDLLKFWLGWHWIYSSLEKF